MTPRDLRESARLLRVLVATERAHVLDDEQALVALFAGVDPIEVRKLAALLEAPANGGETTGGLTAALHRASTSASADAVRPPEPSGVVHAFDNWSRKVPCS